MHPYTTAFVKTTDAEWGRIYSALYASRSRNQLVWIVLGVLLLVAGFVVGVESKTGLIPAVAGGGLIGAGIGDRIYVHCWLKRLLADPLNAAHFAEARAMVSEDGVKIETKDGATSSWPWNSFVKAQDLGEMRLLFVGRAAAIAMLRRSHSDEDWNSLAEWIAARVPNA